MVRWFVALTRTLVPLAPLPSISQFCSRAELGLDVKEIGEDTVEFDKAFCDLDHELPTNKVPFQEVVGMSTPAVHKQVCPVLQTASYRVLAVS